VHLLVSEQYIASPDFLKPRNIIIIIIIIIIILGLYFVPEALRPLRVNFK